MKTINYKVNDPAGIHARPAGVLVKNAKEFKSEIKINYNGKTADAKRLFDVMSLGIKQNDIIEITIIGEDEQMASEKIEKVMKENF